jgi:PhnB protein
MGNATIHPYLFFGGRCEEALAFYQQALGAQVEMKMRFDEAPSPPPPGTLQAGFEHKIMHSSFRIGGNLLMASDGCDEGSGFQGFSLSLTMETDEEARRVFAALSDGGKVTMPLEKTFWAPLFGQLTDRFGISWMVGIAHK